MSMRQARALLACVDVADSVGCLGDLPDQLLPAMLDAVGGDSAAWAEIRPTAGSSVYYGCTPKTLLSRTTTALFERYLPEFPLAVRTRPGGGGHPLRRSDTQSRRDYHKSPMYAEVLRPLQIEEIVAMALTAGQLHVCVALHRAGRDFPSAAVDALAQLRPLLARRVAQLAVLSGPAYGEPSGSGPAPRGFGAAWPALTERQLQVLRLVAAGYTDLAIARRLCCSRRTVGKHLEHIYTRLGVSNRAAAVAKVMVSATTGGRSVA